jgi:hypothetical protein
MEPWDLITRTSLAKERNPKKLQTFIGSFIQKMGT